MRSYGNCGRGGRCYVGAEDVLKGRLASERHEPEPEDDEDEEATDPEPQVARCEHGVPLWAVAVGKCHECAWLYGWRTNG